MSDVKSIMIVGVGGQGTLLTSRILGNLLVSKGFDVKMSEVHGMAQRGGSVVTYVKYGKKVDSPIITEGMADIILAFEELEAYRWVSYAKSGAKYIVNTQQIMPMPVVTGAAEYPSEIIAKLKEIDCEIIPVNALAMAEKVGNVKALNVALLGVLAKISDFEKEDWIKAVTATVPPKFLELNLQAFELGYTTN